MADDRPSEPYPPRWAVIYMMALMLGVIVWIILCAVHGGPPWGPHPW
jgi:hypothetical protein